VLVRLRHGKAEQYRRLNPCPSREVLEYCACSPSRMLEKASPQARVIGNIVITHDENGAAPDVVRAARNIMEWAAEERPERAVAYAGH
jgi:hypothetical protein